MPFTTLHTRSLFSNLFRRRYKIAIQVGWCALWEIAHKHAYQAAPLVLSPFFSFSQPRGQDPATDHRTNSSDCFPRFYISPQSLHFPSVHSSWWLLSRNRPTVSPNITVCPHERWRLWDEFFKVVRKYNRWTNHCLFVLWVCLAKMVN